MNTNYERTAGSDEWYTPPEIVKALGDFDLDPCSPAVPLWRIAKKTYTKEDNGLIRDWGGGRVWLNPPYSRPLVTQFMEKMVTHNHGTTLLFNRCENILFQELILPNASALLFMRGRVRFYKPDGTQGDSAGCGSVLIAFGDYDAQKLKESGIKGFYIDLRNQRPFS